MKTKIPFCIILFLCFLIKTNLYSQVEAELTTNDPDKYSSAIGLETISTGQTSLASGYKSEATGDYSTALGRSTNAIGFYSFAGGRNSTTNGHYSFAYGYESNTINDYSVALGNRCNANGATSIAFGELVTANSSYSCVIGAESSTVGQYSFAFGHFVQTNADNAFVLGKGFGETPLINNKANSLMVGFNSTVPTLFVGPSQGGPEGFGKVGIGTSSPSNEFEVNGKTKTTDLEITGLLGIGTSSPNSAFEVASGDVYISNNMNGVVMQSDDNQCWKIRVNNDGSLSTEAVTCPGSSGKINLETDNDKVLITPNPASKKLYINTQISGQKRLEIIKTDGSLVFLNIFETSYVEADISGIAGGIYIVRITDSQGKVIKEQKQAINY